jgi:hypothetical protein
MRVPAERVEVGSRRIGTGLMGGVQSVVDGQEEGVVEVVLVQLMMRGEEGRKRMAMQSEEAKGRADAAVVIAVVVAVGVVVVVDKSNSGSDQRSVKDVCNVKIEQKGSGEEYEL